MRPKKPKRRIFANTTVIYRPPGSPETYLDGSFFGLFYSAMHELLEGEKGAAVQGAGDELDDARHSLSLETLPKNPLGLVRDQHVISRQHLSWFSRNNRKICVIKKGLPYIKHMYPESKFFCAPRIWSNHAELWMQPIEQEFYRISEYVTGAIAKGEHVRIDGRTKSGRTDQEAITEYWSLCRSRVRVRDRPPRPANLREQERHQFTQAEKDMLEYDGLAIYSTEGDETRAMASAMVRRLMHIDIEEAESRRIRWRVGVTPSDGVVLPDLFPRFFVPIRHDLLFFAEEASLEEAPPPGKLQNHEGLASQFLTAARNFLVAHSDATLKALVVPGRP